MAEATGSARRLVQGIDLTPLGKGNRCDHELRNAVAAPHDERISSRVHDDDLDLALLQPVRPPKDLTPIEFGDSEAARIGQSVAVIGHPGGGGLWTLTTGTISSRRR